MTFDCKPIIVCAVFLTTLFGTELKSDIPDRFHRAVDHHFTGMTISEEGKWTGPFSFIQMADCQLGMYEYNASWDYEIEKLEKAVEMINAMHPRFVIVCGDLTNAEPDKPSYPYQVADYKRIMSHIDSQIPLVCLCGNHDVGNAPTAESIKSYVDNFGSHYFSFWVSGVHCIVLNSSLFYNDINAPDIQKEQLDWLVKELENDEHAPPVHRIVFTHHPWFLNAIEEEDEYFSIPRDIRLPVVNMFVDAGVKVCFAGHYHRNSYGKYRDMEMVTTSAVGMPLGDDPSGFRVVDVYEDRIEHEYIKLEEKDEG